VRVKYKMALSKMKRRSAQSCIFGLSLIAVLMMFLLTVNAQVRTAPTPGGNRNIFAKAELPVCPCVPGEVVSVSDDVRGLWVTDGTKWFPITSEVDPRWFGAKPDDSADDSSALAAALAVAPAVRVSGGTYRLASNLMVPAGKQLIVENGAQISIDPSKTLTVAGVFEAGLYRTFTGTGKVVFGGLNYSTTPSVVEVFPQWWGARANGETDDLDSLSRALEAAAVFHGRVHLVGNYRVSAPLSLPNGVTLAGNVGNAQNWAWITADGSKGFAGNALLVSNPGAAGNQYSTLENIHFQIYNIKNSNFEAVHIQGWSETANIKNISFNMRNSSISRLLYYNNFGPVEFDNINLYYPNGTTFVANEPMYVKAVNGLIVRDLNYSVISPKAPYFDGGLFTLLEGLQIETHPTDPREPNIRLASLFGVTFRDSSLRTSLADSTGILFQSNVLPDLGSFLFENIAFSPVPSTPGSWDKYVVIRNAAGVERDWDAARLVTGKNGQRPLMLQRFSMKEQVFGGVESNNSPRVFQDFFLFNNVANNGSVNVPFNPRVSLGGYGTGNVLILINARNNNTNNAAMIWLTYVDLPRSSGGLQPVFNYVVGNATSNWAASYSAAGINLTNKAAGTMNEVTVTIIHSTYSTWPSSQ
jgi:Pectate lyase superfamily protein